MTKNSTTFRGKLLVITGGGSGIGRETALAFARRGAEVVLSAQPVPAPDRESRAARRPGPAP